MPVIGFTFVTLLLIYLILNTNIIDPADFVQIMLMIGLVAVTGVYAIYTGRQADASIKIEVDPSLRTEQGLC